MSASMNKTILMGNLTRIPELKKMNGGADLCEMSLALNRKTKHGDEVCYVDVVAWGKLASNCASYLGKGSGVLIEGFLKMSSWRDSETGKARQKLFVVAEGVQFLSTQNHQKQDQSPPDAANDDHRYAKRDIPPPLPATQASFATENEDDSDIPF